MKIGKYLSRGQERFFLIQGGSLAYDCGSLDHGAVPERLRMALQGTLLSGSAADIFAVLPLIEEFLDRHPYYWDATAAKAIDISTNSVLLPPVRPGAFLCVGLNYLDHAHESQMELPKKPLLFAKAPNAINGHNQPIRIPDGSQQVDFEAELAVVIGRTCHHVGAADAAQYVAGYTCTNDVSARDFQFADGQWFRGKSCDGFGPLGPWLVTPSELPDHRTLAIRTRVNGRTMQDSNTNNLIFGVPELIEFISSSITLHAGDVIATGTPPGVGFARKPPVYLKDGDCIEVEIEKIGTLRNHLRLMGDSR